MVDASKICSFGNVLLIGASKSICEKAQLSISSKFDQQFMSFVEAELANPQGYVNEKLLECMRDNPTEIPSNTIRVFNEIGGFENFENIPAYEISRMEEEMKEFVFAHCSHLIQ